MSPSSQTTILLSYYSLWEDDMPTFISSCRHSMFNAWLHTKNVTMFSHWLSSGNEVYYTYKVCLKSNETDATKFFIINWTTNQHYPLLSISLGKPHTTRDIAPTPGSSARSLHVEVPSAGLSQPFGWGPQFQNDSLWCGIWVSGKERNHTDSDQVSIGAVESLECPFWSKIRSQKWHCDRVLSWCSILMSAISGRTWWTLFLSHSRASQYYCWLTVCPWGMNSLWTTFWLLKKQISVDLIFNLLILAFFGQGELFTCHSKLCHLVSRSYL